MDDLGPEVQLFSTRLLKYIQKTWLETYGIQDWNLFDIDAQDIPLTNNGNEGTNHRMNSILTHHAQFYLFSIQIFEELEKAEIRKDNIRDSRTKTKTTETNRNLQTNREEAKKILLKTMNRENLDKPIVKESLELFMGKMGAVSAKLGVKKVGSDFTKADLAAEADDPDWLEVVKNTTGETSNERTSQIANTKKSGRNPKGKKESPAVMQFITMAVSMAATFVEMNITAEDALMKHMRENQLNYEKFGNVRSNGDCFFDSMFNLALHHDIPIKAKSPHELRKIIIDSITSHPFFDDSTSDGLVWLRDIFGSKMKNVRAFQKQYREAGVFIDNFGIILFTTMHVLNVNIILIATSNNINNPYTKYLNPEGSVCDVVLAYYQDTTGMTGREHQAGHYESLREGMPLEVRQK